MKKEHLWNQWCYLKSNGEWGLCNWHAIVHMVQDRTNKRMSELEYDYVENLNDYSIGVCFQNKGNEDYTDAQIRSGLEVCKTIMGHYGISEVVRHRDIAPNRKVDPNNKFPWELFKKELNVDANFRTVTTPLNLRSGIGTTNPVMKVLNQNTKVRVLEEKDGWSKVEVVTDTGWVSSKYLK